MSRAPSTPTPRAFGGRKGKQTRSKADGRKSHKRVAGLFMFLSVLLSAALRLSLFPVPLLSLAAPAGSRSFMLLFVVLGATRPVSLPIILTVTLHFAQQPYRHCHLFYHSCCLSVSRLSHPHPPIPHYVHCLSLPFRSFSGIRQSGIASARTKRPR